MKIIIEKYVCDVCNKEVEATDRHYMITLGSSKNWTDEAKIVDDMIQKDLCHECYKTITQLIGVKPAVEVQVPVDEPRIGRRQSVDKDAVKKLWAQGLTHKKIAEKLGLKEHQVQYVVKRMSDDERNALIKNYSTQENGIQEGHDSIGLRVITDVDGMVISVE